MTMVDDDAEKLFDAFYAHDEMENTRRYLAEGRSCADWSDDALKRQWLGAWEDFLVHRSELAGGVYYDTSAELRLRGLALPEDRISVEARKKVLANARDALNRPEVRARISVDIDRFCKEWEKPRN
jgi:hypothetical protein